MAKKNDVSDMKLTSVLKKWLDQQGWDHEININEEGNGARVDTNVGVNDQPHRLILETDEGGEVLTVTLLSPFNVPPARMADMSRILNRLNTRIRFGRLYCWDDEDSNPVIFQHAIDVEGSNLVPEQIGNLVGPAVGTLGNSGELLAAVALTKQPIDALWAEFVEQGAKQEETSADEKEQTGPTEL